MQTNQKQFIAASLLRVADEVVKPRGPLTGMGKDELRAMLADMALRAPFKTPAGYRSRQDKVMQDAADATTMRPEPTAKLNLHRPKGGVVCHVFAKN